MAQVTAMGEIETHKSIVGSHDSLVYLHIGWATAQTLNVDAPFIRLNMECLESTSLAQQLNRVDVLVAAIVSRVWVSLRVLVRHGRSQSIKYGTRGYIFGGDENDRLALTLNFQCLERKKCVKI
jgi:hypothetical protein